MNEREVKAALALDAAWVAELRAGSLALLELAVWGDVTSARLGAVARLRKRALELGEKLRATVADRSWIPHPRGQLKNALASARAVSDALTAVENSVHDMNGGHDLAALKHQLDALAREIDRLRELGNRWAALLDAQYRDSDAGDA
jgi:hypothetical protein